MAHAPANSALLNQIEVQFAVLLLLHSDGTDHVSHQKQASMSRRYIIWRNNHAYDERLHRIVDRGKRCLTRY
jgi:hypothetical protein